MGWNNASSTPYVAGPPDQHCPGDKGYSVRMQQEHFWKVQRVRAGEKLRRQTGINFPHSSVLSRLLIPPDTNSRLCFTFTSICRERREGEREAAETLSHIRFLTFSISLSPKNFLSHGPSSVSASPPSHSFSLSLPLSRSLSLSSSLLPSLPPSSVCLWSFSEALLRLPLLCSPILF